MHATTAEILQAFQDLSPQELIGLYKYAQRHLSGLYTEPLDLVHEALHRSLDGRRNWPAGLPFAIYMIQTMKSIVNHDRERIENRPGRMVPLDYWEGVSTAPGSWASVEDQMIALNEIELARATAERVQQALTGDPLALKVLDGMLAGMSPREIRDSHRMQPKDYDSARHRVMRKLRHSALQ